MEKEYGVSGLSCGWGPGRRTGDGGQVRTADGGQAGKFFLTGEDRGQVRFFLFF